MAEQRDLPDWTSKRLAMISSGFNRMCPSLSIEDDAEIKWRKDFLRQIGCKQ